MRPSLTTTVLGCLAGGLGGVLVYVLSAKQPVGSSLTLAPEPSTLSGTSAVAVAEAKANRPTVGPPTFHWQQIESEDYKQYIRNLRSIGCPEQTVRDIVLADVNKLYAGREQPLKNPVASPGNPETLEQKLERLRQLRTIQEEKRWTVKELLGMDLPLDLLPSAGARDYRAFELAFSALPEAKRDAVQTLQETYWQQSDALQARFSGKRNPEFIAESRLLKDNLQQELAKLLTPQELEDYEIRTSATAKQLSGSLATYFRPSEDEFRKIYRAKRDYENTIEQLTTQAATAAAAAQPTAPADPQALAQQRNAERQALQQARATAQDQLTAQLKASLGEDRYKGYERSQDRTYDLLARCGTRYNLSEETVLQAYELQKSFQAQAASGPGTGAAANSADLQKQLNERLTAILGDQAARGYRRVQGGSVPLK